jgi:hypothetical protein
MARWLLSPATWIGSALPAPDFLHPQRPIHPLAWLGSAACLAGLALTAVDGLQAWQTRADALARHDAAAAQLERARNAARLASRPAAAAAPTSRTGAPGPALLDHPWREVFADVEQATPSGMHWLAMEHGTGGALRLEGHARASDAAVAVAEHLQRSGAWQEVGLRRLERAGPSGAASAAGLRFEVQARRGGSRAEPGR